MRLARSLLVAGCLLCGGAQASADLDQARLAFRGQALAWPAAFARFSTAAANGDGAAAYYLALMYRNGMGTAPDAAASAHWMTAAAKAGLPAAMFMLSNMLAGAEGIARDEGAARTWLEASAERDYPEALQQLALAVQDGRLGFVRDEVRAAQLFKELAHAMKHRPPEP